MNGRSSEPIDAMGWCTPRIDPASYHDSIGRMSESNESPSTEKTWDSFAPPGSTRDKEYARIARQLRYLVGVTIAVVILLGCFVGFIFWISLRQVRDDARLTAQQEATKTLANPQMQESIRQIIHDEVSRVDAQPKTAKSIEHPRTFSDEAAELSEIKGASLDEPSNVRFLISELYSSRPKARELARQLLEQRVAVLPDWNAPRDVNGYYHFGHWLKLARLVDRQCVPE